MVQIININDIPKPNLKERTRKVTLTALALAMEYYTRIDPDEAFVAEARTSLLRYNDNLVCKVSKRVYLKVTQDMPASTAVQQLLFAQS